MKKIYNAKKIGRNDKCRCGSNKKYKKCCEIIDYNALKNKYKNIFVLVGNGLTLDLVSELNLDNLNPSNPLQKFDCKSISYDFFANNIPIVRDELLNKNYNNDFERIKKYIEDTKEDFQGYRDCQLRRFLAISYSLFQLKIKEEQNSIMRWKWAKWFNANKNKISGAISFNYDLILEDTFSTVDLEFYRTGSISEISGIPLFKPHGSIDFDIPDGFFLFKSPQDRWNVNTKLNSMNGKVKVIPESEWLNPRVQADIIPPTENNYQLKLDWVEPGYTLLYEIFKDIDAFLIIGFSYGEADRPEFHKIIDILPVNKEIDFYIVNPNELAELSDYLLLKGYNPKKIKNGLPW